MKVLLAELAPLKLQSSAEVPFPPALLLHGEMWVRDSNETWAKV